MAESSPLYEDLFAVYADNRKAFFDYYMEGRRTASAFSEGLRQYLGLPKTFDNGDGEKRPWVELYSRNENNEVEPRIWADLDSWDETGSLRFGVGVALSHELNSFPKTYFWAAYSLSPVGEKFILKEDGWGDKIAFDVHGDHGFDALFESFVQTVRDTLSVSPADAFRASRNPTIGFLS